MYGHRGIWHDGYKAVAYHQRGTSYEDDQWELYDLTTDFSECDDLAEQRPDVLHELIGRWWSEAERYQVFPLDDRNFAERAAKYQSAGSPRRRTSFRFLPGMTRIPGGATPLIYDRSFRVEATVSTDAQASGVLLAQGDMNGGHTFYVADGRLHYEYHHSRNRYKVAATSPIDAGDHVLSLEFQRTGSLQGTARLLVDDLEVGRGEISSTARYLIGWHGLTIGRDPLSRVSLDYDGDFPFTGTLHRVDLVLGDGAEPSNYEPID